MENLYTLVDFDLTDKSIHLPNHFSYGRWWVSGRSFEPLGGKHPGWMA